MQRVVDVVWLRFDLRLMDNPALFASSDKDCLYLFTSDGVELEAMGAASKVFLHHALASFAEDFQQTYQLPLLMRPGTLLAAIDELQSCFQIERVLWNRSYEPRLIHRDLGIEKALKEKGITPGVCRGSVLFEPWEIKNKTDRPFKVFTPFYKTLLGFGRPLEPLPKPARLSGPPFEGKSGQIEDFQLLPARPRWDLPMMEGWEPSEKAIHRQLKNFLKKTVAAYPEQRDIPSLRGTSHLSPSLHFGLITPRQIWAEARQHSSAGCDSFLRQIVWREFAIYSLYHQPSMDRKPIMEQFNSFPWSSDRQHLRAWQRGQTGYPMIDAGMRELWQTGWMHNRVRLIVGSFLVKNLHLNWLAGAEWFWNTLVDADLANNSMGWQWVAGCGIDPSPYFRIFNPMVQGEKFDPDGIYIKRWLPELQKLPNKWLQRPWDAPEDVLRKAGIELGKDYPKPIVDFGQSRQLALMFYDRIKRGSSPAKELP